MTNDTNATAIPARLLTDLSTALASLRCIHELMVNAEGVAGLPKHARISLEGVLRGLEEYTDGENKIL